MPEEKTWDMHKYMKVPKEFIIGRLLYYFVLVVITLFQFIVLLIIRAQTKEENFIVPDGGERFFISSPDLSCHVDFTGNCDVFASTFPEKFEGTNFTTYDITIDGEESFVDKVNPHSNIFLNFSNANSGTGAPCDYNLATVFNGLTISNATLDSGFLGSVSIKLNDWGDISISIKPTIASCPICEGVSIIVQKGAVDEEYVSHLDCEKCTMYGWYYISAPLAYGDCKVKSTQSIFPFPVMLLFFTCLCIPVTIELIYVLRPPDPCLKLFRRRYEERIKREGEEEIVQ